MDQYTPDQTVLATMAPLTEADRVAAKQKADKLARQEFGTEPQRDHYRARVFNRYPNWLTWGVALLAFVVIFAAANVSMFRVFSAGRDHYTESIELHYTTADDTAPVLIDDWQAPWVGIMTFLMAEVMVLVSAFVKSVFFDERRGWIMWIPIALGAAMAIVGNIQITQPAGLWAWLDTLTPPTAVLFMGIIGERIILRTLEARQAAEVAYQQDLHEYHRKADDPRTSRYWRSIYANVLRDAILDTNKPRGRNAPDKAAFIAALTERDWRALVIREMRADTWVEEMLLENFTEPPSAAQDLIETQAMTAVSS